MVQQKKTFSDWALVIRYWGTGYQRCYTTYPGSVDNRFPGT